MPAKSSNKLYCPLRQSDRPHENTCRGDLCAWWDQVQSQCAVLLLATTLGRVSTVDDTLALTLENTRIDIYDHPATVRIEPILEEESE